MNPTDTNDFEEPKDLIALLELRELVASELDDLSSQDQLKRTFRPLTDGLGLDTPKRPPSPEPVKTPVRPAPVIRPVAVVKSPPMARLTPQPHYFQSPEVRRPSAALASIMEPPEAPTAAETPVVSAPVVQPPSLPRSSLFRRLFSAILDELFVLTLFVLTLGLTLTILSGGGFNWSFASIKEFQTPAFVRFAILEFTTIWLGYFAICVGVLDATFGMWVWGIRIAYGKGDTDSRGLRKITRIVLSFLFYAPIFPLILLTVQSKGRNLLDLLSRTSLYRTV